MLRAISFLLSLFAVSEAVALTLDEFLVSGAAVSSSVGVSASVVTESSSAIGGRRTLFAIKNTLGAAFTRLETFPDEEFIGDPDFSLGYTQGTHTGQGIVTWDGENQASTLTPTGLGSVDLTQDGGGAFQIGLKFFDYPALEPLDLTVRLYDATNSAGLKYSDVTVTLNRAYNSTTAQLISIPFSRFSNSGASTVDASGGGTFATMTAFGPSGSVDVKKVGAIQLILNGLANANAPDLAIDFLRTDGRCSSVPNASGRVLDDCGVCLESPNAGNQKDTCGVCKFGPPQYVYAPVSDACGLCPSAPNYEKAKDPCGVCFGDGSTCADCNGVPNGSSVKDLCGVCGGDGSTCRDCTGTPFGTASRDLCGVCGGDNSTCKDCLGVPLGSAKLDACGICGGSATSAEQCQPVKSNCVVVSASEDVIAFEKRLLSGAQQTFKRYQDELRRGVKNRCKINTKLSTQRVTNAYNSIRSKGKTIFTQGVEVCGDSCVTVSYAEEVRTLEPQFKILEREALSLANKVKSCFARKKIQSQKGTRGVATTIQNVRSGLNRLIEDCKARQVCPTK